MRVIVFAATKGGTGKSTLSYSVGFEAAKVGSVYLVDLDPQKSLTELASRRDKKLDEGRPHAIGILKPSSNLKETIRELKARGLERDFLIVDTPGSHMHIIRDAVENADAVVLPVQPSPLDILAQEDVGRLVDELGKAKATVFVINRVDGRTGIGIQAMDRLAPMFPNTPVKVAQRTDYPRASIAGRTAPEINKDAATEIGALWRTINSVLMKGSVLNGRAGYEENAPVSAEGVAGGR